jgi:hypothetical protein
MGFTIRSAKKAELYIRPEVGMYGAFARLNYKPWYALAEYVDNSIQSFLSNRKEIKKIEGTEHLVIRIMIEPERIVIADTAAGIAWQDFPRAFSPAKAPADTSGLSEYGIGMKAASCWFAKLWHVRTKALREDVERTVHFPVSEVIDKGIEHLSVIKKPSKSTSHYTTIVLEELNVKPRGRTLAKIRSHLSSIYRRYLTTGDIAIYFNEEKLCFTHPPILKSPYYKEKGKNATDKVWKKEIEIPLDSSHRLWGWAALRETASISEAGFSIFRRNRLILGSHDDTFRPSEIFGKSNSYVYQRLFGEFDVEGFSVSHTKDGINWGDYEEEILEKLKALLDENPLPLLDQAEGHRKAKAAHISPSFGHSALATTASLIGEGGPKAIEKAIASGTTTLPPVGVGSSKTTSLSKTIEFEVHHRQKDWRISLELVNDESAEDWYSFIEFQGTTDAKIKIQMNLGHPFSERFGLARNNEEDLMPLIRIVAALCLAEITAIKAGTPVAVRTLRRNFNKLLREALCEGE